jgi:membrane protease YdiL (CAAX protease family)
VVVELVILAIVASILRLRGWRPGRLGLHFAWGDVLVGVLLFVAYMLLYWVTAITVASLFPAARHIDAFSFSPKAPFFLLALFIVINSAFEEIAVTAYVVEALSDQGGALAISASTLIRFSYHLYQGPVASISILPLGILFGAVYWRGRRLWPLMVAHTIANVFAFGLAAARAGN